MKRTSKSILLIFYDLGLGGVQTKIVDIINYLDKYYPQINIHLLLRTRSAFDKGNLIHSKNLKIYDYSHDIRSVKGPFFFTFYVLKRYKDIQPDAVLTFLSPFSLPILLTKIIFFWKKTCVVVNEDNYTSGVISNYKYKLLNYLGIYLLYPLADYIIVPTLAVKEDLHKSFHISYNKLVKIPNWTLLKNTASSKKPIDLLYAGRLDKSKKVYIFLESTESLLKSRKKISFHIFGSGSEKKQLLNYVNTHKLDSFIRFFNPIQDIKTVLKQSKVFIFSSQKRGEGFPVVILEAMAVGTPVVTYKFEGVEDVIVDSKNGYIYESKQEFIKKTTLLLKNKRERNKISKKAKIDIKKYFGEENIQKYLNLLGIF